MRGIPTKVEVVVCAPLPLCRLEVLKELIRKAALRKLTSMNNSIQDAALALKPSALHDALALLLIHIKNEVAQKRSPSSCLEMLLDSQTYKLSCLEHEVEKLQQDLDEVKRRSLGFEQDLARIIKQVIIPTNN